MVIIHTADNQLWLIQVCKRSASFPGTFIQQLESLVIVIGWNAVIQHHTIGNLSCQLHHLVASSTDHDRYLAWFTPAMHHIQLNPLYMVKFTMKCHSLHAEQP